FEVQADAGAELPCLWKKLRKLVSRNRLRSGRKIHVNDSKAVYNPSLGVKELERAVLAMCCAWCGPCQRLEDFLERVAAHVSAELAGYPWYRKFDGEKFPIEQDGLALKLFGNALRLEMEKSGAKLAHLGARVVLEREFNRLMGATRNKGNALFSTAAIHLDHLVRTYADGGLVIFCDRQGARSHYRQPLAEMFADWEMQVIGETEPRSEYHLVE